MLLTTRMISAAIPHAPVDTKRPLWPTVRQSLAGILVRRRLEASLTLKITRKFQSSTSTCVTSHRQRKRMIIIISRMSWGRQIVDRRSKLAFASSESRLYPTRKTPNHPATSKRTYPSLLASFIRRKRKNLRCKGSCNQLAWATREITHLDALPNFQSSARWPRKSSKNTRVTGKPQSVPSLTTILV